jgi:hypothetical protein
VDGHRFDELTRRLALLTSRRGFLRIAAAGVGALTAAAMGGTSEAAYRHRCTLPSGEIGRRCRGVCIDTLSDPNNCGACGRICAAGTFCCDGWCADPAVNAPGCCPPNLSCGASCTSPFSDPGNCGACGNVCGADQDCCAGQCLMQGTDQNCEGCYPCSNGFVCDPDANGPGVPGCICPEGADCYFN